MIEGSVRSSSSEEMNSFLDQSIDNQFDYAAYDNVRSTSFQQKNPRIPLSPKFPAQKRQMAFISGAAIKEKQQFENSRRSVGGRSPTLMKASTLSSKGRMSLSPPATIPRGPNL